MSAPRSRRARARFVFYPLLLACGLGVLRWSRPLTPQEALDALVERVEASGGARRFFRSEGASVGFLADRGYTLALFVGDAPAYAPARFLMLTRIDGVLRGEVMAHHADPFAVVAARKLEGSELEALLRAGGLRLSELDAVFQELYAKKG